MSPRQKEVRLPGRDNDPRVPLRKDSVHRGMLDEDPDHSPKPFSRQTRAKGVREAIERE